MIADHVTVDSELVGVTEEEQGIELGNRLDLLIWHDLRRRYGVDLGRAGRRALGLGVFGDLNAFYFLIYKKINRFTMSQLR